MNGTPVKPGSKGKFGCNENSLAYFLKPLSTATFYAGHKQADSMIFLQWANYNEQLSCKIPCPETSADLQQCFH